MRAAADRAAAMAAALAALCGCAVGPDYVRPSLEVPAAWRETGDWKPAEPADLKPRGPWWQVFADPALDALETQVEVSSQTLRIAAALALQAQALTAAARTARMPTVTAQASASRSLVAAEVAKSGAAAIADDRRFALGAAWEADLWGRIGRGVEAAEAGAAAAAADLESVRLALHAELAKDYFLLRAGDAQRRLLEKTEQAYATSLELTRNRHRLGVAGQLDVLQAETQLRTIRVQAVDLGLQRAQLEHAIALLIGRPASAFTLAETPQIAVPPQLPAGLPSQLLERRPDIAAAERRVAAASAQIGVARAAWFPSFTLTAAAGSESGRLARWFAAPSRFWAIGPAIAETLFDGGARSARMDQANATADGAVAGYRQTVLQGFQEVEDNLAAQRILADEARLQDEALDVARRALTLTEHQYRNGIVSYLNVVTAQAAALAAERNALDLRVRGLTASVALVKALGGGW